MQMRWLGTVIGCSFLMGSVTSYATVCGNLKADAAGYGPFNYNDAWARKNKIPMVDRFHFTPEIEELRKGTEGYLGGNLDYTLRHIPNHHRALYAMMSLAIREKTEVPENSHYTMKCWFQRAKRFAPGDGMVWMVEGIYQNKLGHRKEAIASMQQGLELEPHNPNIHYNLGLLYLDAGEYAKAREHAHLAYQKGFPLQGLKQKLITAGQWERNASRSRKNNLDQDSN